jgi:hypothetical protein
LHQYYSCDDSKLDDDDDDDGNNRSTKQNSKTLATWKLDKQSLVASLGTKTVLLFNCSQYVPVQG